MCMLEIKEEDERCLPEIKAWIIYYSKEEFTIFNKDINNVLKAIKLLEQTANLEEIKKSKIFYCDYLLYKKIGSIKCICCAISEILYISYSELIEIETRIVNVEKSESFEFVKPENEGKIILITGTICQIGKKSIENTNLMFECFKCKRIVNQKITNNVYKVPIVTCSCKSKNYHFLRDHPENRCTDKQEIKLLELYCLENSKSLDVILYGSFILEIGLGDVIEVIGEVKCELVEEDIYQLKVVCNNLNIKKNTLLQYSDNEVITNVIKKNPLFNVKENIMGILISNIFSSIVGHEHVKVGLLLSLFGGTQKYVGFSDTRSEIHVLIVGDPGLGKSRMLLSCLGIIPKTFYISGGSISSSGLTISVNHDQATGEYITEAGALILSDNGICCLDELGKITEQSTLFEAMEDQIVTITKTGIVCTIPAKCTIIAAVNPKHGRFNKNKTLNENLNIDTFLLSRFDLIYILKDEMSGKENYEMYNQIIDRCKYTDSKLISFVKRRNEFYEESDLKYTLSDIRQYIDYARSTVYPILSSIAKNKIKEFYQSIKLDQKNTVNISVLETLMRLTESIAKLELKTVASEEHAIVAIKLYKKIYLFKDNEGKNFKKFKIDDLLKDYVNITESDLINKDKLVELIEKTNVKKSPNELIEILNYRGILIKKGKDEYKINFV